MLHMQCKSGKIIKVIKMLRRYLENIKTRHFSMLRDKVLFFGLTDSEIYTFIQRSRPYYISLDAGQTESIEKSYSAMIAVVVSGDVVLYSSDSEGERTLIKTILEGESSGTLYSMLDYRNSLIEIEGRCESEVILIDPDSLYVTDPEIAHIQQKMLVNLIESQKELFDNMSKRLYCLTQRSIRDKIIKYLSFFYDEAGSDEFDIHMSREELACYLAVDRAALSRSLGELKRDGIIDFKKDHFVILDTDRFDI